MGWREEARQRVKSKQEGNTLKLVEGVNCVRVLPSKKDVLPDGRLNPKGLQHRPFAEFRVHYKVGPDDAMVACGKDIDGNGRCWLCDVQLPALEASTNPAKRARVRDMEASEHFVVNATRYDPDNKAFQAPKPWWMGTNGANSLGVRVYSRITNSQRDVVDPVKGYNLNIERSGAGLKTRYPAVDVDETPTKVPAKVLLAIKPLDEIVPKYSESDQKAAYFGKPRDEDEEDEQPRRRAARDEAEEEIEGANAEESEEAAEEESEEQEEEEYGAESDEEPEPDEGEEQEEPEPEEEEFEAEEPEAEAEEEQPPPNKKAAAHTSKTKPAPAKHSKGKR